MRPVDCGGALIVAPQYAVANDHHRLRTKRELIGVSLDAIGSTKVDPCNHTSPAAGAHASQVVLLVAAAAAVAAEQLSNNLRSHSIDSL